MRLFEVDAREYFHGLESYEPAREAYGYAESRRKSERAMGELIARYDLRDRSVLSIGSNFGFEEYWLHRAGCSLTLVDIDEAGLLEPYLASLGPPAPGAAAVRFFLGDARELDVSERFDVVYASSFTPDEMHRRDTQQQHAQASGAPTRAARLAARAVRHPYGWRFWPRDADPHHPLLVELVGKHLSGGGLFVAQSYAWPVDVGANPHYPALSRRQLAGIGVQLVEIHRFDARPSPNLTVALRGDEAAATALARTLDTRPQLTTFHGRTAFTGSLKRTRVAGAG